jgi:2-polyprenyl-3-methyl-5-hydroxy-6-metoxy-1,4-benzoquinol methylase
MSKALEEVRDSWDLAAQRDAMGFILTTGETWSTEAFLATGRSEITECLARLDEFGLRGKRRVRALDFGCGLGRLAQALAEHYDHVDAVDMAPTMVEKAQAINQYGGRVRYAVNGERLRFRSGSFDLIYTNIVLQHMPQPFAHQYIRDFMRILHPDGVAVFEIPDGPDLAHSEHCLSMYGTPRSTVEEIVAEAGGMVHDAEVLLDETWQCYRYAAKRTP